ncbi:MAG TPA: fibronectin type III domain-containing protein, partial [Chloroflexia bacterium]|nr:fibronectin type III domain-containing protein [Chloroflexia bacterium]
VTVTPDKPVNKVWVTLGFTSTSTGALPGIASQVSADHGASFTAPELAVSHDPDNEIVVSTFNPISQRIYMGGTFKNPRETEVGYTQLSFDSGPSNLSATPVSSSQINLSWQDNSSIEEHFVVSRRQAGSPTFTPLVTLPANTTSYSDTSGLAPGTYYDYQVTATCTTGCANFAPSNIATAGTLAPAFLSFDSQPGTTLVNNTLPPVTVSVHDANGGLVKNYNGNIIVGLKTAVNGATLKGPNSVVVTQGTATFNALSVDTPATGLVITATSNGTATLTADSAAFNATARLSFSSTIPDGVVNKDFTVPAVVLKDGNNSTIPFPAGINATLSIQSGTGTPGASLNSGTTSGSYQINRIGGGYKLLATANSAAIFPTVSNAFNINAGGLNITPDPQNAVAYKSFGLTVQVNDGGGNLLSSYNGPVTVSETSGSGVGTVTATASGGTATFSNLAATTAGSYTLTASAAGATKTSALNITAASVCNDLLVSTTTDGTDNPGSTPNDPNCTVTFSGALDRLLSGTSTSGEKIIRFKDSLRPSGSDSQITIQVADTLLTRQTNPLTNLTLADNAGIDGRCISSGPGVKLVRANGFTGSSDFKLGNSDFIKGIQLPSVTNGNGFHLNLSGSKGSKFSCSSFRGNSAP